MTSGGGFGSPCRLATIRPLPFFRPRISLVLPARRRLHAVLGRRRLGNAGDEGHCERSMYDLSALSLCRTSRRKRTEAIGPVTARSQRGLVEKLKRYVTRVSPSPMSS